MKKNLLLITFLFPCFLICSQTYELSVSQGVYQPLENSISVTNGQVWDDPEFSIPIGFVFSLYDTETSELYSNSGSAGILFDVESYDIEDETFSAIIPMLVDLIDLGYDSGESLSNISYLVEGEEGSRICKVEWSNAGFFEDINYGAGADFVNIQLWLYEEDNSIEFHFGNSDVSNPDSFLGNTGPAMGLISNFNNETETIFDEFFVLTGDPANPNIVFLDEDSYDYFYDENALEAMPESGTIYRFARLSPPVSTDEIRELSTQFSVQPNPASSNISLRTQMDYSTIQSISIFDNNGALMKTIESNYDNINIEHLTSGIYNIQILTDEGLASKRFAKIN